MDPQVRIQLQRLEELIALVQNAGGGAASALGPMAGFVSLASADVDAVLTGAQVGGGRASQDLQITGGAALTAGRNRQLPTVANLIAALTTAQPGVPPVVGRSYRFRFCNFQGGAFAFTVTTNTGWTLAGTMTVAQNTWREFVVTFTNVTAGAEAA